MGAISATALAGCEGDATPSEDESVEARTQKMPSIRDLTCGAESRGAAVRLQMRLGADGKVAEGTMFRGLLQKSPDARLEAVSAVQVGDRVEVRASSGAYRWRFSVLARGFGAGFTLPLDARLVESNDPAVLGARGTNIFSCSVSEAQGGYLLDGEPARQLYDALAVTPDFDPALGRSSKYVSSSRNVTARSLERTSVSSALTPRARRPAA